MADSSAAHGIEGEDPSCAAGPGGAGETSMARAMFWVRAGLHTFLGLVVIGLAAVAAFGPDPESLPETSTDPERDPERAFF